VRHEATTIATEVVAITIRWVNSNGSSQQY